MQKIKIFTSQNVGIEYTLAMVGDRVIANLLDFLFKGAYLIAVSLCFAFFGEKASLIIILALIPILLYNLLMEIFMNGQTIGMRIRNIKVIRIDGQELTVGNCILRWLFRVVDITICGGGVAVISISTSDKGQRLGDIAAGTTVVKLKGKDSIRESVIIESPENYSIQFEEVKNLNDNDIGVIKEILITYKKTHNGRLLESMSSKTKETLKINSTLPALQFLETIVKDYNWITGKL